MAKYIYGKFKAQTVPQTEVNDFHSLSMFLGAYLIYSTTHSYSNFKEFAEKNSLLYKDNNGKCFWSYVNKGQSFIRDKINQEIENKKCYISRRQIRKLGYSGMGSVRMYPLNGCIIQDCLFNYVFTEKQLVEVKELYLNFLFEKWNDSNEPHSYLTNVGGTASVFNTFRRFLLFQYSLLSSIPKGKKYIDQLFMNNTYMTIQNELDIRG